MPSKLEVHVISSADLQRFARTLFQAVGVAPPMAEQWAKSLVWANLRGVDSHGVLRIPGEHRTPEEQGHQPRPPHAGRTAIRRHRGVGGASSAGGCRHGDGRGRGDRVCARSPRRLVRCMQHHPRGAVGYFALQAANAGMAGIVMSASGPMMAYHLGYLDTAGHFQTLDPCVVPISSAYLACCPAVSRTRANTSRQVVW